jgi:DNA-binding transcriptional MerR regulator
MGKRRRFEQYHAKRLTDLRHMRACCNAGYLPKENIDYIDGLLRDPQNLPSPAEIAAWCLLTYEQRKRHRLWTITPPIGMTKQELRERRKADDRERKMIARRRANVQSRQAYLAQFDQSINKTKPWEALGMCKATWYRKGKPDASRPLI